MIRQVYEILNGKEDNYMLPFYWQHGDHHDKIPEQVERIYRSGCRSLCVESRPHKEFCGPSWWDDMDLIISECEKRNMTVWILDDDHFPTGHANGAVKTHPEMRKWMLCERHIDVAGPLDDALIITEDTNEDHILLGAFVYPRTDEGESCVPEPRELTDKVIDGFLHLTVPEGVFRVFFVYKSRRGSFNDEYIDMLRPEAVRLLIDAVYEPHYQRYGAHFGKTLAGFFSDEPLLGNVWFGPHQTDRGIYERSVGMPGLAMPYNEKAAEMMKDALGYDPLPYFPALWFDMGEPTGDVRYAYMDAVTKLYRDCFTRQLGDWCEAHGVRYIGHIIEDMNAHARLGYSCGHYFRSLDGQHMSGVDVVLHQMIPGLSEHIHTYSAFGNNGDPAFFNCVLAKLGSSFAHIGTQTENRAMCELFGAYGWAEGTPCFKWLLDHMLVRGVNHFVPHAFSPAFPDPDCPPHFGADGVDPQFEGFAKLMNYGNRAAHILFHGRLVTDAAVLYHAEAEWYNGINNCMLTQEPAKMLYDEHIDFDILPADCFTSGNGSRVYHAEVKDGVISVGAQKYKCLVVPAAEKLPEKIDSALDALSRSGACVIRMAEGMTKKELIAEYDRRFDRDIKVDGEYPLLRCAHYTADGGEIYMFVNESTCQAVRTAVTLGSAKEKAAGIVLDLLNDSMYKTEIKDGRLELELAPYQSVIAVFCSDGELYGIKEEKRTAVKEKASLVFKVETASYTDMNSYTLFEENAPSDGLPVITSAENVPAFSGRIRYTCLFETPEDVYGIDLGAVGQTSHLYLNGADLGVRVCPPYSYDLSSALKAGKNEMIIEVSNTLANAVRDSFSSFMAIPAAGMRGPVSWLKKGKAAKSSLSQNT